MKKHTVLVVDDDFRVAELHASLVNSTPGFTALPAARTLRDAHHLLRQSSIDLVLVDQFLPDGLGVDLIGFSDSDSFLITADRATTTARLALARGAMTILYKPFTSQELIQRLNAYARYRRVLSSSDEMSQVTVDKALRAFAAFPAGLEAPAENGTLTRFREILAEHPGGLTAVEVAEIAGVSRPTAQRHLASAARSGTFGVELRYRPTGRPEHVYRNRPAT
jgi:response regulator of citrate/malate metabolism